MKKYFDIQSSPVWFEVWTAMLWWGPHVLSSRRSCTSRSLGRHNPPVPGLVQCLPSIQTFSILKSSGKQNCHQVQYTHVLSTRGFSTSRYQVHVHTHKPYQVQYKRAKYTQILYFKIHRYTQPLPGTVYQTRWVHTDPSRSSCLENIT